MVTTSLRFCMTVGPTIRNFYTKLLRPQLVPAVMGYDPLMQFVHEDDAMAALVKALFEDHPGAYNIVGAGTLYYSDVIRLGGKVAVPVPHFLGYPAADALFNLQLSVVPGSFLNFFRYSWVADGTRMQKQLGLSPQFTSRGALLSYYDSLDSRAVTAAPAEQAS
jgi:UDP-glucose 4-epimerase